MKTTHYRTVIAWFKRLDDFKSRFAPKYTHIDPRPTVRRKHPLPKSALIDKSFVPRTIPNYNLSNENLTDCMPDTTSQIPSGLHCHLLALQSSDTFCPDSITLDDHVVIADTGCTMASSCDICDFEPDTYTAAQNVTLHGITSGLTVAGIGYVNWTFTDTHGSLVTMRIHAIHVPGLSV